jgi:hypothetical protein
MKITFWLSLALLLLTASLSRADKLKHEVDKNAPFAKLLRYSMKSSMVLLGDERERMDKAVLETLTAQLAAKGMKEDKEHPDFYVFYMISLGAGGAERSTYSVGQKVKWDRDIHTGVDGAVSTAVLQGTVLVEMMDASTEILAWRGIFTGTIRKMGQPEVQEENLRRVVEKIIKPFPPKTGK